MSGTIIERVFEIYRCDGGRAYLGEQVTILEHVLQTATVAERANSSSALTAASLLHDIGHFLHTYDEDCAEHGIDSEHETVAADFLAPHFPPEVVEPILLHVAAKRYLCATHPDYDNQLTPASRRSLKLQGGPMDAAECQAFENNPHHRDALKVRAWDEAGKAVGAITPGIEHFRAHLQASLAK